MARPSIVPIALTLDDRTGYTLWAPPWEEDGEEWQAFLGSTVDVPADLNDDDPEDGVTRSVVHLFPSPGALAAFCRTSTDHDLADHPVWSVVAGLDADELTPDDDHRFDLDSVYDVVAENPDRWVVEELAATVDIVGRLAECCDAVDDEDDDDLGDDDTEFEAVAELAGKPEVAALGLGIEAFLGRDGEEAWVRLGGLVDELWEDVVGELDDHLDWTGAGSTTADDYPSAEEEAEARAAAEPGSDDEQADDRDELVDDELDEETAAATPQAQPKSRSDASAAAAKAAAEFWESVGILPVELTTATAAGVTLRCYVDDRARFLGREGKVFLFPTPVELARFIAGDEEHDLSEIASWAEVADTDVLPLPGEEDRFDLVELAELLTDVSAGAGGLVPRRVVLQPVDGARDVAEHAGLAHVEQLLADGAPLGRVVNGADADPDAPLTGEDAAAISGPWREIADAVAAVLVVRD